MTGCTSEINLLTVLFTSFQSDDLHNKKHTFTTKWIQHTCTTMTKV